MPVHYKCETFVTRELPAWLAANKGGLGFLGRMAIDSNHAFAKPDAQRALVATPATPA